MKGLPNYKSVDIEILIPYAQNSRTHSEAQITQIASSIKEFGFLNPVIIDGENGIIAGHGRVLAAKKLGLTELPCIEAGHLSDAQRRAYVIADNKLALNSEWDFELLQLEIEHLKEVDFDISLLGFSEVEIDTLDTEEIDYGLLDELGEDDVDDYEENVRRAIQIEFESEDYDEATALISFWRGQGDYVGGLIMAALKAEKDKL